MILTLLGLLLWSGAHLFRRLAPETRAAFGGAGRGVVAVLALAGIVLMVLGYRSWFSPQIWNPPAFFTHLNNLLMVVAVYLFAAAGMKTALARKLRHPMLLGVLVWALAHLLVNGDLASIVLFGGMALWALAEIALINRASARWSPPPPAPRGKEFGAIFGAVALTLALGYVHTFFNLMPFGA